MFRPFHSPESGAPRSRQPFLKRALLFGGALLLLWFALQLLPPRTPGYTPPPLPSAAADTESPVTTQASESPSLMRPGYYLVLLLLAGGGAFAFFLQRRSQGAGQAQPFLKTMGQLELATNQQLRLVTCGGDVLLLGVTGEQVTLLKTYTPDAFEPATPPIQSAPIRPAAQPAPPLRADDSPFLRLLQFYANRSTDTPTTGAR